MAEDLKANVVGENGQNVEELGDKFKELIGEPSTQPVGTAKRICPETKPDRSRNWRNLGGTSVQPWYNLGEPSTEPFTTETFGSPTEPFKTETLGSPRPQKRTPRNLKNLGGALVHPCWNLGGTLAPEDSKAG